MIDFVVYYKGRGEGCDYTIGCNLEVEVISAECMTDAIACVREELRQQGADFVEERYETITIYEVVSMHWMNVAFEVAEERRRAAACAQADADHAVAGARVSLEEHERREYERLKAKFSTTFVEFPKKER